MCCITCGRYPCRSAVTMRIHPARHGGLPDPHFHFCRTTVPCDYDCLPCGHLVTEVPKAPLAHFTYGCCHMCAHYSQCIDYAARHVGSAGSFHRSDSAPRHTVQEMKALR